MAKARFSTRRLSSDEIELMDIAVLSIEIVTAARVVAIVLVDDSGTFVSMRGGMEHNVARLLETIDWKQARLIVGEHIP